MSSFLAKETKRAIILTIGTLIFALCFGIIHPTEIDPSNFKLMIQLATVCIGILFPISINIAFSVSSQISSSARLLFEKTIPTLISVARTLSYSDSSKPEPSQQTRKKNFEKKFLEIKDEILKMYFKYTEASDRLRESVFLGLTFVVVFFYINIFYLPSYFPSVGNITTNSRLFLIFTLLFFSSLAAAFLVIFNSFSYATYTETLEDLFKLLNITLQEIKLEHVKQKTQANDQIK